MKRTTYSSAAWCRLAQVAVLIGFITATGCSPGDNVLTPPEGGPSADQVQPEKPKPTKGISSRREREKEAATQ